MSLKTVVTCDACGIIHKAVDYDDFPPGWVRLEADGSKVEFDSEEGTNFDLCKGCTDQLKKILTSKQGVQARP